MSILAIFFLLLLAMVLWPVVKVAWKLYVLRRRLRNAYRRTAGYDSSYNASPNNGQRQQDDRTPRRGKRIDSSVGTYVDYEELDVDVEQETARQYRKVDYERQQQVSDAEWEEID